MSPAEYMALSSAFPVPFDRANGDLVTSPDPGLTKREYMATVIASGLCADPNITTNIARTAVRLADELIEELAK
jgi:hypothetical protein